MDHLAHVVSESARFAEVLRTADPSARVPSCPDWDAADLLWHLTEVHDHWARIVRDRLDDPAAAEAAKPERPTDYADLLTLYADATARMVDVLAATADDVEIWTWAADPDDRNVGFVRRFQAHEALIHRLDAELTTDDVSPIDPVLATDGIAAVLRYVHSWRPSWASWALTPVIGRLRTSDTGAQWTVQLGTFSGTSPDGSWTCDDEPALALTDDAQPSFEVAATAAELDVWLWHRPGPAQPDVSGSRDDFEQFRAKVEVGVP